MQRYMSAPQMPSSVTGETGKSFWELLRAFRYENADVPENVIASSGRKMNSAYREKLITKSDPALWREVPDPLPNTESMATL